MLSTLTTLTKLNLEDNNVTAGWQHLLPLAGSLASLNLSICEMERVPRQLSMLTGLTRLELEHSEEFPLEGIQVLRGLTRLHNYGELFGSGSRST